MAQFCASPDGGAYNGVLKPLTIIEKGAPPGNCYILDMVSTFNRVVNMRGKLSDTPKNYGARKMGYGKLASRVNSVGNVRRTLPPLGIKSVGMKLNSNSSPTKFFPLTADLITL